MALVAVTTTTSAILDLNQYRNHLTGVSGSTEAFYFRMSTGNNFTVVLPEAAGATKITFLDSTLTEMWRVNSSGAVVQAAGLTVSTGGITITTSTLTFGAAASQLIPGATSFSVRNNANNADNLLISDAGAITVRSTITLSPGSSLIIPGATSLSLRNNANNADNILILDNGNITLRGTVGGITTLTATTLAGTLSTAAQASVTSVGTLTSLTTGNITMTGANAQIKGGTAQFAINNNADTQNNVVVADAGFVGIRAALIVGQSAPVTSGNGVFVQSTSTNNAISTASQGAASATLYIGNASINVTSDVRAKRQIADYNIDAMALLQKLNVVSYTQDSNRPFGDVKKYVGLTAQNLYHVAPWAVNTQGGRKCAACLAGDPCTLHLPWQTKYELLVGLYVKALQQLDNRLKKVETHD